MLKELLKGLAALGGGALIAALTYVTAHAGPIPGVNPLVGTFVAGLLVRAAQWLVGKIPA